MATYKSDFLNVLNERGFIHQGSNLEGLDKKLMEGVQSGYIGFDPTANSLHVGNLMVVTLLYWFQQCGHKPISLIGGGTSKVGDPSGKDESRKMLTVADINRNISGVKKVFDKYLTYGDGKTDAIMVNNADWLDHLNYLDFLRDYGPHFTINRMMSFDSVKLRLEREQPLTLLEFNYMIMQAYDFVELNRRYGTVLQMGGSDQWGNMVNGLELGRRKNGSELFVLTAPLITTSSGSKMGKSVSGAIWLNEESLSPYDYYQFWRNTEDSDVGRFLKIYTTLPVSEIAKLEKLEGSEINEAKKILAFEATRLCHGDEAAQVAQETAQKTFEQGSVGDSLPSIEVSQSVLDNAISVIELLRDAGLARSNGEARRLIQGGGARINDIKIEDVEQKVNANDLTADGYIKISAGRKKHALVRVKNS